MPNEPKWTAIIEPPTTFCVKCGPLFDLQLVPDLTETAKIENVYQEASKVILLAAAAPELYEALESLIEHYRPFLPAKGAWQKALTAVAKARGGSPDE